VGLGQGSDARFLLNQGTSDFAILDFPLTFKDEFFGSKIKKIPGPLHLVHYYNLFMRFTGGGWGNLRVCPPFPARKSYEPEEINPDNVPHGTICSIVATNTRFSLLQGFQEKGAVKGCRQPAGRLASSHNTEKDT